MKTSKRILLWLTLVAMIVTLAALTLPVDAATYQGSCGVTVDWSLDTATGVLTISGSGDMYDYDGSTDVPWNNRAHLIKSVEIKDFVRSIGAHAFFSCRNLTSITIPNTVSKLGDYAFGYCTGLETVTFGNDVRNLGEAVFYECTSLTAIEVPEDNPVYKSVDGVLYSKGGTFFIQYPIGKQADSYTIANGVIDIKNHAFSHSTLSQVKIPNSVELIEKNAFADCGKLKSIQLPSGLLRINDGAFARCNSLKTVILGGKVKKLGEGVFRGCLNLTSVTLPDTLTVIPKEAFYNCENLTEVRLGKNVTAVGESAFAYCYALQSISLPDSVSELGWSVFQYCSRLTQIALPDKVTVIPYRIFDGCTALSEITIGEGVVEIVENAFRDCTGLVKINFNAVEMGELSLSHAVFQNAGALGEGITVTIGKNVKRIPDYLFRNKEFYDDEEIGAKITKVVFQKGSVCSSIGAYAFAGCTEVKEIELPDGLEIIGADAFLGCKGLKSIVIPDSVEEIQAGAWGACTNLERVVLGAGLTKISDGLFSGCTNLRSIELGDSIESIGHSAFEDCERLTSIRITPNVASMGVYVFENCKQLTVMQIDSAAFVQCVKDELLKISTPVLPPYAHTVMVEQSIANDLSLLRQRYLYTYPLKDGGKEYVVYSNIPQTGAHTHSFDEIWRGDAENHWYLCTRCEVRSQEGAHFFDSNCDADCDDCGYLRDVTHVYDHDCDESCNQCGAVREVYHQMGIDSACFDQNGHWQECLLCGFATQRSAHVWDKGVVVKEPTTEEDGLRRQSCACGATRDRIILRLPAEQTTGPDVPVTDVPVTDVPPVNEPDEKPDGENALNGKLSVVWIAVTVLAIVIVAGGVIFWNTAVKKLLRKQ